MSSNLRWAWLLMLFAAAVHPAAAGPGVWTSVGPFGGNVTALAAAPSNPSIVYCATDVVGFLGFVGSVSVFRSDDGGASWRIVNPVPTTDLSITSLAIDPRNPDRFIGAQERGLVTSTDGGTTWVTSYAATGGSNAEVDHFVAFSPSSASIAYASTDDGVVRSSDGGVSWKAAESGLPDPISCAAGLLAVDPNRSGVVFAATCSGLYRTTDGGKSWSAVGQGLPDPAIKALWINTSNSNVLFASSGSYGIYRSTDDGRSWASSGGGLPFGVEVVELLALAPGGQMMAGTFDSGIFVSDDGGSSWSSAGATEPASPITAMSRCSRGVLAGSSSGLSASSDFGTTWSPTNEGLGGYEAFSIAADPTNSGRVYCGISTGEIVMRDQVGGPWQPFYDVPDGGIRDNSTIGPIGVDPADPRIVLAAVRSSVDGRFAVASLSRTADAGATWSEAGGGLPGGPIYSVSFDSSGVVYVGAGEYPTGGSVFGIFRSTDGGETFGPVGIGLSLDLGIGVVVDAFQPGDVYAMTDASNGTGPDGLAVSTDSGTSWAEIPNSKVPPARTGVLAILPGSPPVLLAATGAGIYSSGDLGVTWTAGSGEAPSLNGAAFALSRGAPNRVFLRTTFAGVDGVSESDDYGISWRSIAATLPNVTILDLAIDASGRTLHAATSNGVYDYEVPDRQVATPGLAAVPVGSIGARP